MFTTAFFLTFVAVIVADQSDPSSSECTTTDECPEGKTCGSLGFCECDSYNQTGCLANQECDLLTGKCKDLEAMPTDDECSREFGENAPKDIKAALFDCEMLDGCEWTESTWNPELPYKGACLSKKQDLPPQRVRSATADAKAMSVLIAAFLTLV